MPSLSDGQLLDEVEGGDEGVREPGRGEVPQHSLTVLLCWIRWQGLTVTQVERTVDFLPGQRHLALLNSFPARTSTRHKDKSRMNLGIQRSWNRRQKGVLARRTGHTQVEMSFPRGPEWLSQLNTWLLISAHAWSPGLEFKPRIGIHLGRGAYLEKKKSYPLQTLCLLPGGCLKQLWGVTTCTENSEPWVMLETDHDFSAHSAIYWWCYSREIINSSRPKLSYLQNDKKNNHLRLVEKIKNYNMSKVPDQWLNA